MGLINYLGHRLLAIFLAIVSLSFFITPSFAYAQAGQFFVNPSAKIYLFYFFGLVSGIASAYFFKTQH